MLLLYYIYCASVAQDTRITLLLLATSAVTSGNEGRGLGVQHEFKPPHVTLGNKGSRRRIWQWPHNSRNYTTFVCQERKLEAVGSGRMTLSLVPVPLTLSQRVRRPRNISHGNIHAPRLATRC